MNAKMIAVDTLKINFKLITTMLVYRQTPNIIFLIFTCYYRQIKFKIYIGRVSVCAARAQHNKLVEEYHILWLSQMPN